MNAVLFFCSVDVQTPAEKGEMQFNFSLIKPPRKDAVQFFPDVTDFEGSQKEGSLSSRRPVATTA